MFCSVLPGIYYKRKVQSQMGKNEAHRGYMNGLLERAREKGKKEWVGMGRGMRKNK
jgi:hypothetical protein